MDEMAEKLDDAEKLTNDQKQELKKLKIQGSVTEMKEIKDLTMKV